LGGAADPWGIIQPKMALTSGTRLGAYEILSAIGAGGMGEVYRARDTKLGRDVAIKVLPEAFAHDADRLSRFQREAKMLASLNHPNIATIHGLEQSGGTSYLVMELVSGDTLQERVKRDGPLPIDEALAIAKQIAEALEAAHEKGIIHRDLKPANVKLTPEGKVKVLDFGLAKAFAGDSANDDPSNSPTLSAAATMQGTILGTAAYMSPEQARAKAVDKRTDIWAFGCVLYELLAGRQAFQGETTTEILAAVLRGEPDWQALPETTPLSIRVLLRRCLQKEMNKRARDAGDARIEIEDALTAPTTLGATSAFPGTKDWRQFLPWASGLVLSVVVGVAIWNLKPSLPQPVTRAVINLPPGQQLAGLENGPAVALSPDGAHLAYVARQGGTQQIYLRAMDSLDARPIRETEGGFNPFFSPDGQWVGFFAGGKLKKVSVNGGAALNLADVAVHDGASWDNQGTIIFPASANGVIQQMSDSGGPAQPLTRFERGSLSHRWPEFLPGGKAVLFAAGPTAITFTNAQVAVQTVGTGQQRNLIQGGMPRYALSGHLVYAQKGSLMAMPFDPQQLTVTGAAVPVVEGVLQSPVTGAAQYSISATGSLVYVPGGVQSAQLTLVWVNRNGAEQPLAAPVHAYVFPRLSPDGRRVAMGITESESQIWLYDLSRETLSRFTFEGNYNPVPVWTPDGKRIAFESNKEGVPNVFWQLADGSGGLERLTTSQNIQAPHSFSPDGQLLVFNEVNPATGQDIWVLRMGDPSLGSGQAPSVGPGQGRKALPFLRTPFNEANPRFSPDGRWLAYISDESGRFEIYVQPYPGPGGKWQISTDGGTEPMWNPAGRELFYRSGDKMMAVDISTQSGFTAGKPRMLFEGRYELASVPVGNYDVSSDGQRFLMLKPVEQQQAATQINVVVNWFEELKRRVPTGAK
jgi:serine/threonine protein kinase/Tol biopolymer transport system component